MAKRVAVLAVNPVNGLGLFQYLESFYENRLSTVCMQLRKLLICVLIQVFDFMRMM